MKTYMLKSCSDVPVFTSGVYSELFAKYGEGFNENEFKEIWYSKHFKDSNVSRVEAFALYELLNNCDAVVGYVIIEKFCELYGINYFN